MILIFYSLLNLPAPVIIIILILSRPIRVVLADDHEMIRLRIAALINNVPGIMLVGDASNGIGLVELVDVVRPDMVLTDIKMPRMDGIKAT